MSNKLSEHSRYCASELGDECNCSPPGWGLVDFVCLGFIVISVVAWALFMFAKPAAGQSLDDRCWRNYACQQASHVVQGAAVSFAADRLTGDLLGPDEGLFVAFAWALGTEVQDVVTHTAEHGEPGPGEPTGDLDPFIDLVAKTGGAVLGRFLSIEFQGVL